jgi:hypothetical protein
MGRHAELHVLVSLGGESNDNVSDGSIDELGLWTEKQPRIRGRFRHIFWELCASYTLTLQM